MGNSIALDIGSAYVEGAIFLRSTSEDSEKQLEMPEEEGVIHFIKYKKSEVALFKSTDLYSQIVRDDEPVLMTGSRSDHFYEKIQEEFGIRTETQGTTPTTIRAIHYLWENHRSSFFVLSNAREKVIIDGIVRIGSEYFEKTSFDSDHLYPYLLVNIRTGVSLYRVDSPQKVKRVNGTNIGTNSILALIKMLTNVSNPVDYLNSSMHGNNTNVDMTVEDIYGEQCDSLGLPANLIAATYGKTQLNAQHQHADQVKSLLLMFAFNLTQIVYMQKEIEGVDNVIFADNTPHDFDFFTLYQFSMNYWSQLTHFPIFVDLEPYLRCLGTLLTKIN